MDSSPFWRLLDSGLHDGSTNMAIDEALLSCFDSDNSLPVLRIYGWAPSCLSLGRFQDVSQVVRRDACAAAGIDVVRRITGGGALYHTAELTYSIVCPTSSIPGGLSVRESFRVLTSFLLEFYRGLGLNADFAGHCNQSGDDLGRRTEFCFAGRERYDILIDGKKVGGNAQRRQKELIFQHGSIPLENHADEGAALMCNPPRDLDGTVAALADLGVALPREELQQRLVASFASTMGVTLVPAVLSADEGHAAAVLRQKYL